MLAPKKWWHFIGTGAVRGASIAYGPQKRSGGLPSRSPGQAGGFATAGANTSVYSRATGDHRLLSPVANTRGCGSASSSAGRSGMVGLSDGSHFRLSHALVPLILRLRMKGPVLAIEASRPATVRLAKALAGTLPEDQWAPPSRPPGSSSSQGRGGHIHSSTVLRHGVAYHHGSLPAELRDRHQEAVSDQLIDCVVATTTLTEGIDLPVRSVGNRGARHSHCGWAGRIHHGCEAYQRDRTSRTCD